MQNYLIKIIGRPSGPFEVQVVLDGDYASVRHGQSISAPGETLEVWRGGELIFKSQELGVLLRARSDGSSERGPRRMQ